MQDKDKQYLIDCMQELMKLVKEMKNQTNELRWELSKFHTPYR